MLDSVTKRRIDDCRDILVGKLPDPKAQIEQITIALIYKFMDDMDKEVMGLGGKAKFFCNYKIPNPEFPNDRNKDIIVPFERYSWDNLFNAKVTATEMLRLYSEAITGMDKNPNIPQLFRDIFKNAFLPYRDPETLKLFLKTIDEFEYTHSEKLGDAFEYLLSVMGSQGDAGQFRTPRHIIDFIIRVVDTEKNETVLDPACGTAGFLISAFKHIKEKSKKGLTPDERKRLMQNFVGYDISPDMVRLSLVNLYLHGFSDPHIWEYDTLSSEDRWDESFDVILANPPFMSPKGGIRPHKKFSIASNRSEVLFVDYIAEHLKPNGRAGIIVPEGVIFQSGAAYKELRKVLVKNYLYGVVSLPAGVFNPYSGVKTSILLMDKEFSKKSNEIVFVKIENDGYSLGAQRNPIKGSQLEEAIEVIREFKNRGFVERELAHVVSKIEIAKNEDYNLSGDRYKTPSVLNSTFKSVMLGDLFEEIRNGRNVQQIDERGKYRVTRIQTIADKCVDLANTKWTNDEVPNEYFLSEGDILLSHINSFDHLAKSAIFTGISEKVVHGINLIKLKPDKSKILPEYAAAIFKSDVFIKKARSFAQKAVNQASLKTSDLKSIQIPLPPLSIQKEIVSEIEQCQKIINGAKAIIENYKVNIEIDPNWDMAELDSIAKVISGVAFSSEDFKQDNPIKCIKITNVGVREFIDDDSSRLPEGFLKDFSDYTVSTGDVVISLTRTIISSGLKVAIVPQSWNNALLNQRVAALKPTKRSDIKFIYHYLCSDTVFKYVEQKSRSLMQPNLSIVDLKKLQIPTPPIDLQERLVSQIEKEEALVNANKDLIKMFEQKITDRIAKVWGK